MPPAQKRESSEPAFLRDAQSILTKEFGLSAFRLGQREIIETVLSGKDALAVLPTGGGKSLCYQLPALLRPGVTLVISPLIALMRDQVMALKARGIAAGCLYGTQDLTEKREVFAELGRSESFLLYVSPERVQKDGFRRWFSTARVSHIAIDEAHCISQWGADFRPDYFRLRDLRVQRPEIPILALTATATPLVLGDISGRLGLVDPDRHVYGFYRPNLFYQVEFCASAGDKIDWLHAGIEGTPEGRILVYCGTRRRTEEVCEALQRRFAKVDFYHAGLAGEERNRVQDLFERGEIRILVATNAFGMGVDCPNVRLIMHDQMPASIDAYYQEAGRAGRDGLESTCLLLYSKRDKGLQSHFIHASEAPDDIKKNRWRTLDAMVQFAEGGECRHAGILTYFRDANRIKACGHCDVCLTKTERRIEPLQVSVSTLSAKASKKGAKKSGKRGEADRTLTTTEQLRCEILKEWRKAFAQERDVPAFMVFSNRTLEALARENPSSLDALSRVHGIGPQKLDAFGKELLKQLRMANS